MTKWLFCHLYGGGSTTTKIRIEIIVFNVAKSSTLTIMEQSTNAVKLEQTIKDEEADITSACSEGKGRLAGMEPGRVN